MKNPFTLRHFHWEAWNLISKAQTVVALSQSVKSAVIRRSQVAIASRWGLQNAEQAVSEAWGLYTHSGLDLSNYEKKQLLGQPSPPRLFRVRMGEPYWSTVRKPYYSTKKCDFVFLTAIPISMLLNGTATRPRNWHKAIGQGPIR